jgi:hypothetical protein
MNRRENVKRSLNFQQPDRLPIDFGSTSVTGMHVSCVAALREHFQLEKKPVKVHEPYQMLGLVEEDLAERLGLDVEGVFPIDTIFGFPNTRWKPWQTDSGLTVLVSEWFNTTKEENGDTLIYPKGDVSAPPSGRMPKNGHFFDTIIRQRPIEEDKLDPEDNLEEFGPLSASELDYFARASREASDTGRAVIATFGGTAFGDIALVPAPFLKHPKGIRDITEWYISTVTRQDYIHRIFSKQAEIALANLQRIKSRVGDTIDVVFVCGTDFGTQTGTFCSEDTYRGLYMPYYRKINDWIHANTGWKTFKHSCGAVKPFIRAMIESGFDILNPVQCTAKGMDARDLKREYGRDIVFWGGGIDTQTVLPFGTPEQVREQVLERCEIFARDGGFIFNAIHNVQANTPLPNLVAMFDALADFNGQR